MNDELPPLPKFPTGLMTVTYEIDRKVRVPVFDEHKMREYAQQAVEAERKACMNALNALPYQRSTKYDCMDAIRARGNT